MIHTHSLVVRGYHTATKEWGNLVNSKKNYIALPGILTEECTCMCIQTFYGNWTNKINKLIALTKKWII